MWGERRGADRRRGRGRGRASAGIIKATSEFTEFAITLAVIDAPSRLDSVALAAIRAADLIIIPTMPDLINLAPLSETALLIKSADKLGHTIAVINNADGQSKRVEEAREEPAARPGDRPYCSAALEPVRDRLRPGQGRGRIGRGQGPDAG